MLKMALIVRLLLTHTVYISVGLPHTSKAAALGTVCACVCAFFASLEVPHFPPWHQRLHLAAARSAAT